MKKSTFHSLKPISYNSLIPPFRENIESVSFNKYSLGTYLAKYYTLPYYRPKEFTSRCLPQILWVKSPIECAIAVLTHRMQCILGSKGVIA